MSGADQGLNSTNLLDALQTPAYDAKHDQIITIISPTIPSEESLMPPQIISRRHY